MRIADDFDGLTSGPPILNGAALSADASQDDQQQGSRTVIIGQSDVFRCMLGNILFMVVKSMRLTSC